MSISNQYITIDAVVSQAPDCPPGTNNGSISIKAYFIKDKTLPLEYSIDAGRSYQTRNIFEALSPNSYNIVVRAKGISGSMLSYDQAVIIPAPDCPDPCDQYDDKCGTVLFSGDLMFMGFDLNTKNDIDRMVLTTLVNINPNTPFTISNAAYETGAAADLRTDQWYAIKEGGAAIHSQRIIYTGSSIILKGSTICFDLPDQDDGTNNKYLAHNFQINGIVSKDFCVSNNGNTPNSHINLHLGEASPLFLLQGDWTFESDHATLCGRVLSGMQYSAPWYTLSEAVPTLTNASRLHPQVACFSITSNFEAAAWQPVLQEYSWLQLLNELSDFSGWNYYAGGVGFNLPKLTCATSIRVLKKLADKTTKTSN